MALSGSITGATGYGGCYIRADWSATQNQSGNYSTVSVYLYLIVGQYTTISATESGNIWLGDSSAFSRGTTNRSQGTYLLHSNAWNVYHASDGTGGFTLDASFTSGWSSLGTLNMNATYFTLNTIPRYASYLSSTPYAEAITSSQFQVAVNVDATCDNLATSLDGGGWVYTTGDWSGWKTKVLGGSLSSGTTHTFKTSVRRKDSQLWSESSTKSVTLANHSISNFVAGNITDTNFKVYYNVNDAYDTAQYSLNGGAWVDLPSPAQLVGVNLKSETQYSVKIRVKATVSQKWTESSTINVTTLSQNKFMEFFDDRFGKAGL
jgi:hypothetical protein